MKRIITLTNGLKVKVLSDNEDCTLNVFDASIEYDPECTTTTRINYSEVCRKDLRSLCFYRYK